MNLIDTQLKQRLSKTFISELETKEKLLLLLFIYLHNIHTAQYKFNQRHQSYKLRSFSIIPINLIITFIVMIENDVSCKRIVMQMTGGSKCKQELNNVQWVHFSF